MQKISKQRSLGLREKLLAWIFGPAKQLVIIVPNGPIEEIAIKEGRS